MDTKIVASIQSKKLHSQRYQCTYVCTYVKQIREDYDTTVPVP